MWGSKPHRSPHPKWHLERFSRFTGLTIVTDRQTDRQTDDDRSSVTIGRIYVRSTAMRHNNSVQSALDTVYFEFRSGLLGNQHVKTCASYLEKFSLELA